MTDGMQIVGMCWAIQNLSGNSFSNYSTYFLTQAGLDPDSAYGFALGQYGINMVVSQILASPRESDSVR
jgi:SP family general alpha glucoside:H+ symporter-like MFS transporter